MTIKHALALILLASVPLSGCNQAPTPPAAAPAASGQTAPNDAGQKGFIARQVDRAFDEARRDLHSKNLPISGNRIQIGDHRIGDNDDTLPKAEITPQGDLLIEGKPVAINAQQRRDLLTYREQVIAIAEAGMAIGSQGVGIAGMAVGGIPGLILGGEKAQKEYEARIEAESKKIEAAARQICTQLTPLLAAQQRLAESLPAFKPYATMTQADIDDCGKDSHDDVVVRQ
ncbi:hypothetical protein [Thermomonas sp.]|uniref:hypothetical protein n=1 Tax=Thermomonas sp. TaxID=1971895 RepID=UPI00262269C7|nr:hypothetical protein [Thermomonas sp.]